MRYRSPHHDVDGSFHSKGGDQVVLGEVAASHMAATDLQAWKRDGAALRYGSIVGNCACVAARLGPDLRVLDAEINPRVSKKARGSEIGCWPWRSNNGHMSVSDADASSEIQRGGPRSRWCCRFGRCWIFS
jgi:hypothetical protein